MAEIKKASESGFGTKIMVRMFWEKALPYILISCVGLCTYIVNGMHSEAMTKFNKIEIHNTSVDQALTDRNNRMIKLEEFKIQAGETFKELKEGQKEILLELKEMRRERVK